jgi:hypothetical protein
MQIMCILLYNSKPSNKKELHNIEIGKRLPVYGHSSSLRLVLIQENIGNTTSNQLFRQIDNEIEDGNGSSDNDSVRVTMMLDLQRHSRAASKNEITGIFLLSKALISQLETVLSLASAESRQVVCT